MHYIFGKSILVSGSILEANLSQALGTAATKYPDAAGVSTSVSRWELSQPV